jgi:hypothetical protein
MNLGGKVKVVIINAPGNLHVLFVPMNQDDIHAWNQKVDEYLIAISDFAKKFLASNGVVLLFHLDDLKVFKEVKFYLDNYGF